MIFNDYSDSEASSTSTATSRSTMAFPRTTSDSFESSLASSLSEINMDNLVTPTTTMTPDVIQLDQFKWNYRGEGGANLVISLEVTLKFIQSI